MKRTWVFVSLATLSACHCVRLEDYRVCDATVDCSSTADASIDDAGGPVNDDGGVDGGACVPDGLVDQLDPLGLDTDCDGVDGVKGRQLYVDRDQGNDSRALPGDPLQPFATLTAALNFAASADGGTWDAVLVTSGGYDELGVVWRANVDLWGGRSGSGTWAPTASMSNLRGGSVALVIQDVQGRTMRGFQVRAGSGPPLSIAVLVENASPRFVDVQLYGGAGGAGATGDLEPLADAGPGNAGFAGVASGFTFNPGPPGVCGGEAAYAGGAAAKNSGAFGSRGEGPDGGAPGGPPLGCTMPSVQAERGSDGDAGADGAPGTPAMAFGSLAPPNEKLEWLSANGAAGSFGTSGLPGQGGGGGGAPVLTLSDSSSGGSGGSGGCPGARGLGGSTGGPTFGLVVRGGRPFLGADTFVLAGAGGVGGQGGPSGAGLPGGAGGAAGPPPALPECTLFVYGSGAPGGAGGRGGHGGRGGGGAGGHSVAIYCDLDGGFELDGGSLMTGPAGSGSDGARDGVSIPTRGCAL
ncbi:MAG: hypothetical protein Q8N23_24590 [Archangium sp.]|nr:hypothetical protein [Archangium sp.]MDP3575417.1 hypothetical protein [Archangium sp.]